MKLNGIIAGVMIALVSGTASAAGPKLGQAAPNAELVLADGKKVHLADLRGQVVILNYWATWCVPCRTELPLLNAYYLEAARRGWPLKVFAVATEDSVPKYQLKHLFSVLSISPTDRIHGGTFGDVEAVPTNYVIDKAGIIRYAKAGAFSLDDLNGILVPLLNEPEAMKPSGS